MLSNAEPSPEQMSFRHLFRPSQWEGGDFSADFVLSL